MIQPRSEVHSRVSIETRSPSHAGSALTPKRLNASTAKRECPQPDSSAASATVKLAGTLVFACAACAGPDIAAMNSAGVMAASVQCTHWKNESPGCLESWSFASSAATRAISISTLSIRASIACAKSSAVSASRFMISPRRKSAQAPQSPPRQSSIPRRSSFLAPSGKPVLRAGEDIVLLFLDLGGYDVDVVLAHSLEGRHSAVQELDLQVQRLRVRASVHLGLDFLHRIDHVGELLVLASKGQADEQRIYDHDRDRASWDNQGHDRFARRCKVNVVSLHTGQRNGGRRPLSPGSESTSSRHGEAPMPKCWHGSPYRNRGI